MSTGRNDRGEIRQLRGGREAPRLWVRFQCPKCLVAIVLDAYDGPPSCLGKEGDVHRSTPCTPMDIVRGDGLS